MYYRVVKQRGTGTRDIRDALEEFHALLNQVCSHESEWQRLFASCPEILANALPLRVESRQIEALGRPGKTEPDFVIHPDPSMIGSPRGVIEIKTPDTKVLRLPRKEIVTLSSSATTAIGQVNHYSSSLQQPDRVVVLGSAMYLFVVMGLSKEWADLLQKTIYRSQLTDALRGVRLFGYDQIFENALQSLPRRLLLLTPNLLAETADAGEDIYDNGDYEEDEDLNSFESIADIMFNGDTDAAEHWLEKDRD